MSNVLFTKGVTSKLMRNQSTLIIMHAQEDSVSMAKKSPWEEVSPLSMAVVARGETGGDRSCYSCFGEGSCTIFSISHGSSARVQLSSYTSESLNLVENKFFI